MFKNIEREINEFIAYNSIETELNVKHSLLNVVDKIRNSPKFLLDINNDDELEKKTILVMKKYILETTSNRTSNNRLNEVEDIAKVIILDTKDSLFNKEWNSFSFDEDIETKNLNLECLIVKSKEKLDGPHVHIRCKQMARSTILTEKQIKDYHTSLVLTRILNLGDIFYYHYQPIKSLNPSSSIRLVLSNLDLQVIDHKNKPLKFKEHFDNLSWKVDYNNSTIQVFSKLNEIRNFAQFYAIDAAKNKYYFKIQNQDDEKIILKADDNSPLDKENELENCLYSDVNESTMYFTYN
jgi:hypothetical protein